MREVQFQRALYGRYLNTTSVLTGTNLHLGNFGPICIQNSNVPLRIDRCKQKRRGSHASEAKVSSYQ
jgi:hypothetical protein